MFLDPLPESFVYDDAKWKLQRNYQKCPLSWFATHVDFNINELGIRHFEIPASDLGRAFEKDKLKCWAAENASWRQVRISHYANSLWISVDFLVERHFVSMHAHMLDMMEIKYVEMRVFDADATIGDVFEAALDIDCRDLREHADAMVELAE